MHFSKYFLFVLLLFAIKGYGQQDVDFHLNAHLLPGKKVLKVKRDFHDPYLWVLTAGNGVYRINSLNLQQVDDYTSVFSSYSNLQFVDIVGRSQDTVFIATNSTNVIEYKNGIFKTIGLADGLKDPVNSIGISNFGGEETLGGVEIGTTNGRGEFNPVAEQFSYYRYNNITNIKIFDATYRSYLQTQNNYEYYAPTLYPIAYYGLGNGQISDINPINESGSSVTTAYYALQSLIADGATYEAGIFWGNEKGLFQEAAFNYLYNPPPFGHYLNNINVNKVTDILGLTSLGNPNFAFSPYTLTKENLLIGTDNGLYFSSSIYGNYDINLLRTFSLFRYDELGNVRVNDICVNATATNYSDTQKGCEDGVWVACDNGLYLIKPDYGKYFDPQQRLTAIGFNLPDNVEQTNICSGSTVQLVLNSYDANNNAIQWVKDGQDIPGATGTTLTVQDAGDYNAIIYSSCENIHVETNHLKVKVISAPVFGFNYPDKIEFCDGTASTVLKTDNNAGYKYRWYTNGVPNGGTDYQYTVTQSGKYNVEVSACTDNWVPSKEVEVDLIYLPVPVITADKPKYCAGDNATLTISASADPGYTINWYKDGNVIPAVQNQTSITAMTDGSYSVTIKSNIASCTQTSTPLQVTFTAAPVFTFNYPDKLKYCSGTPVTLKAEGSAAYQYRWYKDGVLTGDTGPSLAITKTGNYKVDVSGCDGSWVQSNGAQVDFISIPLPIITTDKPVYCIGDNAKLSISVNPDPGYTINWYRDNILLPAYSNQISIISTDAGSYTVAIISNGANTDGTTCAQTSAAQTLVFNPLPTVSIQKIVRTTLCSGQTVDLQANYSNGTLTWSTGANAAQISVTQPGTYRATVTSDADCTSDASVDVQFFPNPVLNLQDATVCAASHKAITLTAPAGLATYSWNGQAGSNTYVVDRPQKITLTVTDTNGCQATQDIQIADECPDIRIPNAFTPNGDGINDTWAIIGLEYDPTARVRVFTRYGQQVYQSKGYGNPWAGEYQGKKLPAGAYYYIINAKNDAQTYSGEVTIIY